ncbi:MAG: hypothetical protein QXH90_01805 [Candidatus Korarchaeum sp.]
MITVGEAVVVAGEPVNERIRSLLERIERKLKYLLFLYQLRIPERMRLEELIGLIESIDSGEVEVDE